MALPEPVLAYLNDNARSAGVAEPKEGDDLFKSGVLDSFALVDFLSVLEQHTGVSVPDSDVSPSNFQTVEAIERYVNGRRGQDS
ncbi:MAG TPA: phosphopantetheine-binding protein [Pyrinomonadaceae bacterium]|nr:phosphopantetheine-binding protein [Pyrinomonadaceae bacterium]